MERQCTWAAIAIAALLVLGFDASASISAEEAVSMINYQTGISPFCYISGDTVRQIYEGNDLNMDFPDYTLTSRYPVYSYDPRDSSSLESVYSVSRDGFKPVLYEVLGGTFTKSRVDSGTYQFHWIVANQLANEIDLIRIDPFWTDDPVVVARYSLSIITIYNTVSGQGPSGQGHMARVNMVKDHPARDNTARGHQARDHMVRDPRVKGHTVRDRSKGARNITKAIAISISLEGEKKIADR